MMRSEFNTSKADKYLWIVLVLGSIISTVFIACIIWVLVRYNHISLGGDIDKSLVGILGDFIGGIIGTIFTIIATFLIWLTYNSQRVELAETRRLVKQQLEATHLPHFTFKKHSIHFTDYSLMKETNNDYKYFNLELLNIGNEPAKDVILEWNYFNSFDRIDIINSILKKLPTKVKDKHLSNLDYLKFFHRQSVKYFTKTVQNYDYILPVTIKEKVSQLLYVSIPFNLAAIYYELNTDLVKHLGEKQSIKSLGYINIKYKNSLNSSLVQEFELRQQFHEEITQEQLRQSLEINAIEVTQKDTTC